MLIFLILTFFMIFAGVFLHHRQNSKAKLGGDITPAKSCWLFYCVYTWLIFLPFILFTQDIPAPWKETWMVFTAWFWLRSVLEIYMLFVSKNWTPPIGIGHDLSCIIILLALPFCLRPPGFIWQFDMFLFFHLSLVVSLCVETYYAYAFFNIVGQKTKGAEGIWYANKEDPVFRRIILITTIFNWLLFLALITFTCFLVARS